MPESTSSKIRVSAAWPPASTTVSASMKRASSPPEATCSIGPGAAPGLVVTTKLTWSQP
jgi:hypothetical protein